MGLRRKSTIDVIDLTKLQESGILQKSLEIASMNERESLKSNEVIDFGRITSKENSTTGNNNMFGFLDNLAGVNSNNGMSNLKDNSNLGDNKLMDNLKIKIDDLEYKLERLMERLARIEEKFS